MSVLNFLASWCTPTTFVIYCILCFLPSIYMASEAKKFVGTEELNKKYHAFHRYDVANWSIARFTINNFLLLGPIRFAIAWTIVLLTCT